MADLVDELEAPLLLDDEAGADELVKDLHQRVRRLAGYGHQAAELGPPSEHRQELEDADSRTVEVAEPAGDAFRKCLGEPLERRGGEIPALLEQGPHEHEGEERIS